MYTYIYIYICMYIYIYIGIYKACMYTHMHTHTHTHAHTHTHKHTHTHTHSRTTAARSRPSRSSVSSAQLPGPARRGSLPARARGRSASHGRSSSEPAWGFLTDATSGLWDSRRVQASGFRTFFRVPGLGGQGLGFGMRRAPRSPGNPEPDALKPAV